jgi:hypothetical protein
MIVQNLTDSLKQSINSNKGVCRNCSRWYCYKDWVK